MQYCIYSPDQEAAIVIDSRNRVRIIRKRWEGWFCDCQHPQKRTGTCKHTQIAADPRTVFLQVADGKVYQVGR